MIDPVLAGTRVLICRPEPSASELALVLRSVGAECEVLPSIAIKPLDLSPEARQIVMNLDLYHQVIVVSQHAAELGLELIDEFWPQFPTAQNWYAIGRKTAEKLHAVGTRLIAPNEDLSSEDLLQLPELQAVRDQKILLLKGMGGRDTLRRALVNRGAKMDALSLYQRVCPDYGNELLSRKLSDFDPHYIVALSGDTLSNLVTLANKVNIDLSQRTFILSSKRVANIALEHGFKLTCVPENLMPIDIIQCIAKHNREISS